MKVSTGPLFLLLQILISVSSIHVKNQESLDQLLGSAGLPTAEIDKYERGSWNPDWYNWGRIELGSDYQEMLCLSVFDHPEDKKKRISLDECSMEDSMFFYYQHDRRILTIESLFHSAMAVDFSSPVEGTDAFYLTMMSSTDSLAQVARGDDWAGHLESVSYGVHRPMIFSRYNVTDAPRYCVRAANDEYLARAFAIPLQPGQDPLDAGCSTFRIYHPPTDFVLGQFLVQSTTGAKLCATYNGDSAMSAYRYPKFYDPSQISAQPCEDDSSKPTYKRQQFWIHRIMGHIRWNRFNNGAFINWNPRTHPVVTMWWSGPLRMNGICRGDSMDGCVDMFDPNHRWVIPDKYYGPVISRDPRGFSGRCWTVTNQKYIEAQQKCSLFLFKPHTIVIAHEKFDVYTPPPAAPISRAIVFQTTINHTPYCLAMVRVKTAVQVKSARRATQMVSAYKLRAVPCGNMDSVPLTMRFVMSARPEADCQEGKSCDVHLRWSADPQNALLWPRQGVTGTFLSARSVRESELPDTWNVAFNTWNTIQLTHKNQVCWSLDANLEVVMSSGTRCTSFRAIRAPTPIGTPANVTVVQEFNALTNIYRASEEKYDMMLANKTWTFQQYRPFATVYFADVGVSGIRNFMMSKAWMNGDSVSIRWGGGLSFPFVPYPLIDNSPFGLITVEFIHPNGWDSCDTACQLTRAGHSFLLFSFESMTGCDVYITQGGHLGLRCSINDQASVCQARFNTASLFDTKYHTVSLLYSTQKQFSHRLYVDGQLVMTCNVQDDWSILWASPRLTVMNQLAQWKYVSFDGMVRRVAVRVGSYNDLRYTASTLKSSTVPAGAFNATKLSAFETSWENCVANMVTDKKLDSIRCELAVTQKGKPFAVPRDVFSLGCARPTCEIFFAANQSLVGSRFNIVYRPNYPENFDAKNIGDPGRFQDYALVTDGFGYGKIQATVHYVPAGTRTRLETSADSFSLVETENEAQSSIESQANVQITDFIRYLCVESCCARSERKNDWVDGENQNQQGDAF